MTDNEIIKVGYIYAYFYDNQNTSFSIVEVVRELSDEVVVVKFHQVFRDDSGNGFFNYLCDNDKTMNVSKKYLHKIDLVNRQKSEIERLQKESVDKERAYTEEYILCKEYKTEIERLKENNQKLYDEMAARQKEEVAIAKRMGKSEAIKEFWEKVKTKKQWDVDVPDYVFISDGDNLVKEMTEQKE